MAFDQHKNLASSAVAVAPSPASSGTSLSVVTGEGARFPAAPFNVTISPKSVKADLTNSEIARVTTKTGDAFTIVRAQEGTTARAILVGDTIALTVTAKSLLDIESGTNFPLITTPGNISAAAITASGNITAVGNVAAANLKWRQSHTWALIGDVSAITALPYMWVQTTGTQVTKIVNVIATLVSGTSINMALRRNSVTESGLITVTTSLSTTPLNITVANNDYINFVLASPVGAPTTLSVSLILEHTL